MIAHDRTEVWLAGIALIGLAASVAAAGLLWMVLTKPIALMHWADRF